MNNDLFNEWLDLESEVSSAIGLEVVLDPEGELAKDWI